MTDRNLSPENPRTTSQQGKSSGLWVVVVLAILVVAGGLIYGWPNPHGTTTKTSTGLSGQATSSSGSTTAGAPAGTPPSQTTGQAVSPSGSTTTGSKR